MVVWSKRNHGEESDSEREPFHRHRTRTIHRRRQEGSYLVLAAFVLVMLLLAALLGVDIARKYRLEQLAQDVADAAAVAGALALPDVPKSRTVVERYIQQVAGNWYQPDTVNDIQIAVAPDNSSGTVGVLVKGMWTAQFMPRWLGNTDSTYAISRYAIAVMKMTWESETTAGPYKDGNFGDYALFLGDTTLSSHFDGNGMWTIGSAHLNACADVSPPPAQYPDIDSGTFEAQCFDNGGVDGATEVPTNYIEPPIVDPGQFVADVTLDKNDPAVTAYYTGRAPLVLDNGPDGLYGTADDITHPNVDVEYFPAGNPDWKITTHPNNMNITGTDVGGVNIGNGLDINVVGDLDLEGPQGGGGPATQKYWYGSFVVSGKFTNLTNNSEIRAVREDLAVDGKDNPGLAIHSGSALSENDVTFTDNGKALNVYGLLYTKGIAEWNGTMSNESSSDPGSSGGYDADGNGFVKGALYAHGLDVNGTNFKVWYDEGLIKGPDAENSQSPLRPSLPRVALLE